MSSTHLGVTYDHDYRGRLATGGGGPTEQMSLSNKQGIVIHYAGGAQNRSLSSLARWQGYARWHIRPNGFGNGFTGNGIMYHAGVSDEGESALLYDPRITRWHAGSGHHNRFYVSINIPIGGTQQGTPAQLVKLDELCHEFIKAGAGQDVRTIIGHMEASSSHCPGWLQSGFVQRMRSGHRFATTPPPKPKPEPEADHLIVPVPGVGKFWIIEDIYKRYVMVDEPLFLFGYPLTGQKGDTQHFERARMHIDPGTWPERHDVHLARVGYELADEKGLLKSHPSFKPAKDPKKSDVVFFSQTEQFIFGRWKAFWEEWGGVEYFGYPISGVFTDPDTGLDVQYFERARFEYHRDSDWHADYHSIGLGRVNAELLDLTGGP